MQVGHIVKTSHAVPVTLSYCCESRPIHVITKYHSLNFTPNN